MQSKTDTLLRVIDYVKNESYNPVAELLLMGFTPCQLVNEFHFEEEKVKACPLYLKVQAQLEENLEETEYPKVLSSYSPFDATLMERFRLTKEQINTIKETSLYQKMKDAYQKEKEEILTDVMHRIIDRYKEPLVESLKTDATRYYAILVDKKAEDMDDYLVYVSTNQPGNEIDVIETALMKGLFKDPMDSKSIGQIKEIHREEYFLHASKGNVYRKQKELESLDKTGFLKMCLIEKDKLSADGIKAWEYAIQQALEKLFPNKEWYELTKVPIFMELLKGKAPITVCELVWKDIAGEGSILLGLDKKESLEEKIKSAMPQHIDLKKEPLNRQQEPYL